MLEYNVRFGDPETQTLLPLLESDLAEIMLAATSRCLDSVNLTVKPSYSTTVVVAAGGYPGKYAKGDTMTITKPGQGQYTLMRYSTKLMEMAQIRTFSTPAPHTTHTPTPSQHPAAESLQQLLLEAASNLQLKKRIKESPASNSTACITAKTSHIANSSASRLTQTDWSR